jgi:hypothetical protein
MKTIFELVLCLIFSLAANCQKFSEADKAFNKKSIDSYISNNDFVILSQPAGRDRRNSNDPPCRGNGIVTFINSSPQPLYFYYWYVEDVVDPSHECWFRRFWKQLDRGNNTFIIPENKTLIFRICTSPQCSENLIKQYGIVYYCNASNGIILVK